MAFYKLVGHHDPGRSIPDPPVGVDGDAAGPVHERFGDQSLHNVRLGVCRSASADSTGRAVWTLVNLTDALFRDHYFRILLWLSATTPLWIAGAAVSPEARVLWWALAAGLDMIGRWLAHLI